VAGSLGLNGDSIDLRFCSDSDGSDIILIFFMKKSDFFFRKGALVLNISLKVYRVKNFSEAGLFISVVNLRSTFPVGKVNKKNNLYGYDKTFRYIITDFNFR
jgi:hypothetical protein